MLFRERPSDPELHLKINNAENPKVTATKFLGIVIDDRLNCNPHTQSVKSKLSSILSIMYKASNLITTAGMYTLYCSLFQPYMSLPCYLVPSSRIRLLATSVAAPLHPALSLAYRLMLLMVASLEYPTSVSSHLCLGIPLLLAPFILLSITSSSIHPALTKWAKVA